MWDNCFHPSGTFVEFPIEDVETSIPERFEKIVATYPDRVAVKTPNRHLTYAQLNSMANRVAHAILAQHGNESEPVGLLLEKDVALIAAMLGVLKAGKFFALLDPSFPQARIGAILEDSQTGLVLTDQRNLALAREAAGEKRRVIDVGSMGFPLAMENLRLQISPKALAYIIYTSGSTGQPKGVVQNHRNLLHRVMLYTNAYHICSGDRLSLLPTGTSNTVTHGFTALLTGASLFPYDAREQGSPALASWLICEKISFCWISSPLFRNLVASLTGSERFPDLRLIQLTSETVYRTDVDLYKKHFSRDCLLACGLSSSETGLLRLFLFDQKTEISGNEAPVGYAIQDKEIALLDNAGKTVAFNQIGTIVVRSRYLSPGYWNRPDLTEAKFKPDPQGGEVRLYFTGDIGVMLPDGCLIHKGRKDFRVKIRGYGVELAEIERALLEHDAVREAVVTTQQNPSGDARLIAYFTPVNSLGPGVSALLRYLKKKLPDYMIPTTLVRLDTLPLTSNGKVNRSALPIPGKSRPELDTLFTVPRTSVEETLAKIWAEVLGLDQIGIGDNFFDLGGNSLLAMRVISRILDRFQVELPLIDFFATPTIADLAGYIETANLAQRRTEALSIQPTSRDGRLLLSSAQQRLWFLDQLEPGSFAYNLCSATQLTGRLDVPALHRSFNEIIMRHEALRTVFKAVDGEPLQIILPSLTLELPIVDLRGIASDTERDHELRRLCTAEAQRSFDLARGPLLRITLLRLSEEEYILLRTIHHVVFDGWSSGILAQELAAFYKAFSDGTPLSLPALPIQYADFAQWQQQWMRGAVYKREIAYWKKKLENLPTLHLPTDRPRPPVQKAHGAREYFAFSESLSARLKSLGNRHQVTLFMTLLAAYQTLLYRYTGQNDIVVGSPVAGRNRSETEGLIGFFLNMLVLQTDLSGNPTFRELLSRVREVCLESYAHQEVPFEKLVEELQPDRDLNRNPLFQVAFVFQDTTLFPLELPGLTAKELEFDPGITRFDLRLFVAEEEGRLRGCIDYNADLFHQSTITRLLRHLQTLLEGIVSNPDERIERLAILTAPERRKLLIDWTDNEQDYPRDRCIHELFEAEVERAPNAAAVVFEDQQLTYRELNRAANKLARHLRKLGVAAEATVGICIERSLEMVVGVLGILKAGGAYVYLDPTFPKERLAFIMGDAGVRVLLTRKHLLENLPEYSGRAIFLDRDSGMFLEEEDSNVQATSDPESLAYVVYTSGSTGKPKGVLSHHRGVANYLGYIRKTYHLHNTDTVLQLPSLSFDASVRDLIGPLTAGAKVVLVKDTAAKDPTALLSKISQHRVTCLLSVVPTMLNGLINAASGDGSPYDSVRLILVSGEALQLSAHAKAKEVFGRDVFLVNQYGPTECTMTSTYWPVQTLGYHREALIGKPIPNARIYILDGDLNPVPIGVPGQIYIGGDGLAWGYLNRPELTAETFVPNRFGDKRGARLYSTGDLGRYLSDGNIEFLGRIDNQVKIRGFRVELGEIEAVIGRCPSVQQAVVLAREKGIGDRWLVAYIVPNSETAPPASEVSGFLRNKLPDYMVPSAFVFLDSLPLTPNGKVNRKALPVPSQNCPEFEESFVAPRTPVEELLANTWAEVLKLDRAGVHDNFFDLGGHSLLATQVISRICQAFKVELPLRALFERPTVAELAKRIEEAHGQDPRLSTRPMVPVSRDRDLPLSFSQQRLWFLDQYEPNSSVYNIPRALRLRGPLNIGALEQSLNEIIRRHESLRTTFSLVDGEAVQMIAPSVGLSLAVVDLRDHPEGERGEEARTSCQ